MMRPTMYRETVVARVDSQTRETIETIAYQNRWSLAEATRELLYEGMRSRGLIA